MLKADKACVWQTLQTLCEEDCFVADAVVLMLAGILSLPGITLPSIELLPCWKKKHLPSFNVLPVLLIDRTLVQQWSSYRPPVLKKGLACRCQPATLWANHSLQSFHFCKGLDQWRVSPSQCWKLKKIELGRHLRPCVGKSFSCWCCCVTASGNPVATRNHVAEHWNLAMLEEKTFALVQWSNPDHNNPQYRRKGIMQVR